MAQQEKIRLMTRLAILEKQHGKQIRKAENAFRIDLVTNPVWKMGFFVSLVLAAVAGILALLNINMFLDAFASGQLKSLILIVLIAYVSILLVAVIASSVKSYGSYRRCIYYQRQYRSLLERLRAFSPEGSGTGSRFGGEPAGSSRYNRGRDRGPSGEDWEDESGSGERGERRKREELDYRHMQTLEFEDDEYSYYVEAVPKRGGRRG